MALLRAAGQEGKSCLQSVGFNMRQRGYENAFALLDDRYGKKNFVKTEKFVLVSQLAREDDRDCLVSSGRLSNTACFDGCRCIDKALLLCVSYQWLERY